MPITKLDQLFDAVQSKPKRRLVAAFANDAHTIEAVNEAREKGIIDATLVGDEATIRKILEEHKLNTADFEIVHEPNDGKAAAKAVELVRSGHGQILMKGLVSTDKYMRAILNKDYGLMNPGAVLSHVTVLENPNYPKLLVSSDAAVLTYPDLNQKIAITHYVIQVAQSLGIAKPKIALICATEQVSDKVPATMDAAIISKMAERGQIKGAFVDGPMALDVAVDKASAEMKGMHSEVAGDADGLVFPNIDAGNVFYKTNTKLCGCEQAAMVVGANAPCVLSSRGDSSLTKLYSIALAALNAK